MRLPRTTVAGFTYVAAWLAGLAVAPAAPAPDAAADTVAAFYAAHRGATTVQSLLVHALAGVALLVFARSLRAGPRATAAGVAAAVVSLAQAAMGVALAQVIAVHGSAGAARAGFVAINLADALKLALVAAFVVLVARRSARSARPAAGVVAALQVVGGLAFVTALPALYAVLYAALPALLLWVGAIAAGARRAPAGMAVATSSR
jgi:hypothetical protein